MGRQVALGVQSPNELRRARGAPDQPKGRLAGRVGSRWRFAIEWDVPADSRRPWLEAEQVAPEDCQSALLGIWNSWLGCLWLWADGHVVGRPWEVRPAVSGLNRTSRYRSKDWRAIVHFAQRSNSRGGSSSRYELDISRARGQGRRFEVMPRGCPFFDDWKAILIEEGESETLIWRARRLGAVESATWPLGTFRDVVLSAIDFFARDGGARSAVERIGHDPVGDRAYSPDRTPPERVRFVNRDPIGAAQMGSLFRMSVQDRIPDWLRFVKPIPGPR